MVNRVGTGWPVDEKVACSPPVHGVDPLCLSHYTHEQIPSIVSKQVSQPKEENSRRMEKSMSWAVRPAWPALADQVYRVALKLKAPLCGQRQNQIGYKILHYLSKQYRNTTPHSWILGRSNTRSIFIYYPFLCSSSVAIMIVPLGSPYLCMNQDHKSKLLIIHLYANIGIKYIHINIL